MIFLNKYEVYIQSPLSSSVTFTMASEEKRESSRSPSSKHRSHHHHSSNHSHSRDQREREEKRRRHSRERDRNSDRNERKRRRTPEREDKDGGRSRYRDRERQDRHEKARDRSREKYREDRNNGSVMRESDAAEQVCYLIDLKTNDRNGWMHWYGDEKPESVILTINPASNFDFAMNMRTNSTKNGWPRKTISCSRKRRNGL